MHTHWRRLGVFCLLLLQILVLSFTNHPIARAQDQTPQDQPEVSAVTEQLTESATSQQVDASAAANALGIAHGAHLRPVFINYGNNTWYSYGNEVLAMNSLVGKDLAIVMYFVPWSSFDPFLLNDIQKKVPAGQRPVIMLTWEPSRSSTGCDLGFGDGQGPLRSITSGRCDSYIHTYARAIKARPERFIVRLAHEMNLTTNDWWPGHWHQDASAYVAMFQRVRNIFREEGVTNAEWMWSPNYASEPIDAWNGLHNYYPGDANVDWIGLSGYNWYSALGNPWQNFGYLYDLVLRDMACRYAKPVIIAEIGSVDGSGEMTKANWVNSAYHDVLNYPFVRGIVWFNDFAYGQRGKADFRVTTGTQDCKDAGDCSGVQPLPGSSGQQATNAFVANVRQAVYTNKLPSLAQATPPFTVCSTPAQPFTLNASTVSMDRGGAATITLKGFLYSSSTQITAEMPSGIRAAASPSVLAAPWGVSTVKLTADPNLAAGSYRGTIRAGSASLPVTINVGKAGKYLYLPHVRR